jgi:hypothetical protein
MTRRLTILAALLGASSIAYARGPVVAYQVAVGGPGGAVSQADAELCAKRMRADNPVNLDIAAFEKCIASRLRACAAPAKLARRRPRVDQAGPPSGPVKEGDPFPDPDEDGMMCQNYRSGAMTWSDCTNY